MKKFCIDITNGLAGFIIWGGAIVLAATVFVIGPLALLLTGAWVVCMSVVFALWFAVAGIYEESQKQTEYLKLLVSLHARERGIGYGLGEDGRSANAPSVPAEPKLSHPKLKPGAQLAAAVLFFVALILLLVAGDWIWNFFQSMPK
ncbi:hypothetical protein Pa193_028 [Pseudomonas virus Pa193]|uniref:Uncharacterized protein n=1 Tax=Pseudomonas virus Pa193 TaxID=2590837 RepID=A0A5P1KV80_9CAUD|nr:hypothetical protein H6S64_gp28 [Pseudomonas virus Pa193]QDH45938.1 hypothetical protein Pa193_028 [Pseudomonas virus Pa193]